jgi:nicotinamide riboside kinase
MPGALTIAIVGAESTGKTTLASTLASTLAEQLGQPEASQRVAWVPEWLRQWCALRGRTPRADEQAAIAARQHECIRAAAAAHDIVVADTTALMTAVYSRIVFGDRSLDAAALALHREAAITLVTAIDLPWVADGHQRDGAQVREPVDDALRELLREHGIEHSVVAGRGPRRAAQALAAVARHPALRGALPRLPPAPPDAKTSTPTLFSRLLSDSPVVDSSLAARPRVWVCDCCVPEAERALAARARAGSAAT